MIDTPAPSSQNIARALMLVNGEFIESADGRFIEVESPSTRTIVGEVPRGGAADVDRAVRAAEAAFPAWSRTAPRERGKLLLRIAERLEAAVEDIARTVALETGNAIRTQARPEVRAAADAFRYFGGLGSELKGETIPLSEDMLCYTRREPYGVVAGIIPWNAPVMLAAVKIGPALCAGNTLVLKAAEDAPLGVLAIARICAEILPPGVLNVITGTGLEAGAPLAEHPLVRKVSFTGSTEVGKSIMRTAADRIAPVSLELGGKSPNVVLPDSDDDRTVDGVITAMRFTRQGQSCTAGSRLFLHASIFDSFLDKLAKKVAQLKIGDPLDEATDMGAIVSRKQYDRVCSYIEEGIGHAEASLIAGGLPPREGPLAQGYFVQPTIFAKVSNAWRIAREEIFGPVLVAIPWTDEADVVRMANDSHYGLAAFVWTREIGVGLRMAHAIESGFVQVNQGLGQHLGQSYGGFKQSGIGKEFSLAGMLDGFTHSKTVTVSLTH